MQLNCPNCSSSRSRYQSVEGFAGALLHFFGLSVWECLRCEHQFIAFGAARRRKTSQA